MNYRVVAIALSLAGCITISGAETVTMKTPIEPPHSVNYDMDGIVVSMIIPRLDATGNRTEGTENLTVHVQELVPAGQKELKDLALRLLKRQDLIN